MNCHSPWPYLVFSIFGLSDLINVLRNHDATDILFFRQVITPFPKCWTCDIIWFHNFGFLLQYSIALGTPHFQKSFYLDFGLVLYPINGIQFRLILISAPSAVCPFSPTQVLSELIQPPGPHCSSPSWVTPASGTICRLLVDRQKGGSLQFLIACSGKDSL
jgi:hypothetical protein